MCILGANLSTSDVENPCTFKHVLAVTCAKQSPSFNSQNFVVPHVYFSSKFTVLNNCLPSKVISSLFLGWLFITV